MLWAGSCGSDRAHASRFTQVSTFGWRAAWLSAARRVHFPLNTCTFEYWRRQLPDEERLRVEACADAALGKRDPRCSSLTASTASVAENARWLSAAQPLAVFDEEERYVYHDLLRGQYYGRVVRGVLRFGHGHGSTRGDMHGRIPKFT